MERPSFWRFNNPIMWACITTLSFAVLIVWFGLAPTCNGELFPKGNCPPKWRHLYVAPPNEVGDTLAGLAGVLAFIWLIATVLLQSVELGEQRRVLALQKEEMEEQRKATQDMARAMAAQAKIFEDEALQRDETRARELLDELVKEVCNYNNEFSSPQWLYLTKPTHDNPVRGSVSFGWYYQDHHSNDDQIFIMAEEFEESATALATHYDKDEIIEFPSGKSFLLDILHLLTRILELRDRLSEAQRVRLDSFRIRRSIGTIEDVLDNKYWGNST